MATIVSGNHLGLDLTSLKTPGQSSGIPLRAGSGAQRYVNVFNGNLILQERDDFLAARGGNVEALRTYNSQGGYLDDNADNWSTGLYRRQLTLSGTAGQPGSTLTLLLRDGGQALYTWDAAQSCYLSTDGDGAYRRIRLDDGNDTYVWSDGANTMQEIYARSTGRLSRSVDAAGNRLDYRFDANGNLTQVTSGNGEATCYDYNGRDLIAVRVVTADGASHTRTRYAYDDLHRLAAVTVDLTPDDNSIADGRVYTTRYAYDGHSKRVSSLTLHDGSQVRFSYVQTNDVWRIAAVADGLGNLTRYAYGPDATTVTDALGQSTVYAYDDAGQLSAVTDAHNAVTRYRYNERGDVVQTIDAEGRRIDMAYDERGNLIRQEDAAGNLIERRYDDRQQLIAETVSNRSTGEAAQTTRYVYEAGERRLLRFLLSAQGRVTEYRYDALGQRSTVLQHSAIYDMTALVASDPDNAGMSAWAARQNASAAQRTDLRYDARGQLSQSTTYDTLDAAGNGEPAGAVSLHYVYDQAGLLLKRIAGNGDVSTYVYDGLGRVIAEESKGQLSTTRYDDAGNSVITTAANGLSSTRVFDAAGRLISVTQSSANVALGTTRYTYDAAGRLTATIDPLGNRQRSLYDAAGRKIADIDARGAWTEYSYNRAGQLTRTRAYATATDAALLSRHDQDLPAALSALRPAATAADHVAWRTYDSAGRLSKEINALGAVSAMRYDAAGHLIALTRYATLIDTASLGEAPADAGIAPEANREDRVTRYFYEDGLLRGTLDAEGYLTETVYNNAGQTLREVRYATVTAAGQHAAGTLETLRPVSTVADLITRTLRNSRGQAIGVIDAQGYLTETRYDANGNAAQTVRYATAVADSSLATLTAAATLASLRPAATAQDRTRRAVYDEHNRLQEETDAQGTLTRYRYDASGNLVATERAAGTDEARHLLARYDQQGRLSGELSAAGAALLSDEMTSDRIDALWQQYGLAHTYDALGRRTGTTQPDGQRTSWVYDANGRLTHTINALGEVSETRYDMLGQVSATVQYGQRLSDAALLSGARSGLDAALAALRQDGDTLATYRYDSLGLMTERSDAATSSTRRYYNSFGELIRQTRIDNTPGIVRSVIDLQYRDRLGRVAESVADAGGDALHAWTQYDAFGRAVASTDARGNVTRTGYDRLGRQITLTDAIGGKVSTVYDAFDRIVSRNDHGAVSRYRYDAATRSTVLTTPDNISIATTWNRHGQQQSVTDGRGNVTRFDYDANGNLIAQTQGDQRSQSRYDNSNRLIATTDADGRKVVLTYDAANRVTTRTVDPGGLNLVTRTTYDARGRRIGVTDPNGQQTRFDYDSQGRLLRQITDPDGLALTTRTAYDANGKLISVTSPNGSITQYRYDGAGRRVQETVDPAGLNLTRRFRYDRNGNLTHVTDANGNVTRYAYDQLNRLVWTVNAQGAAQQNVYDGSSTRILRQTSYANALANLAADVPLAASQLEAAIRSDFQDVVTFYRYDAMGRRTWQINASGVAQMFQTESGVAQRLEYDADGNVICRIVYATPLAANQLASLRTDPSAVPAPVADTAADQVQRSFYDANNRLRYSVDGAGAVVEQKYDAAGNVTERIAYSKTVKQADLMDVRLLTSALNQSADAGKDMRTRMLYDNAGRLQFEINAQGGVTERRYDANGNVQQQIGYASLLPAAAQNGSLTTAAITSALISSPQDRTSTTIYDAANRPHYQIDGLGFVTQTDYDANGNVARTVRYATAVTPDKDTNGKMQPGLLTASAQDVTEYRHYDAANRLLVKVDGLGYVSENRYDNLGNITSIVNYSQALARSVKLDNLAAVQMALGIPVTPAIRPEKETIPAASPGGTGSGAPIPGTAGSSAPETTDKPDALTPATPVAATVVDPAIDNDMSAHLRVSSADGSIAATRLPLDQLKAGDVVTLTLRVKSDQFTAPAVRLFGTFAGHEAKLESVNGNGDWKTVKLTLVLKRADILFVNLCSKRDATAEGNSFVLYRDISYSTNAYDIRRSFENIRFDPPEKHGLDQRTLQPHADYLSKFNNDGTWAFNNRWSVHGNVERRVAGVSTGIRFSEAGSAPLAQSDTVKMDEDGAIAVRYLGKFKKGDTVTFSVRVKSSGSGDAPVAAAAGFLGVNKNGFRSQLIESSGNDNWNTITGTAVLQQDDELFIALNSCWPYLADEANSAIYFTDIKVSSVQRGIVLNDPLKEVKSAEFSALNFNKNTWAFNKNIDASVWYAGGKITFTKMDVPCVTNNAGSAAASAVTYALPLATAGNPIPADSAIGASATVAAAAIQPQSALIPTAPHTLIRYTYDSAGNLIKSVDALGYSETYAYNALGQRTSFTNKLGAATSYLYDSRGNLRQTVDALGFRTIVTYDSFNQRIRSSDQRTGISSYAYDNVGNLIASTDGEGNAERNTWDALRNRTSVTNKLGGITRFTYDTLGRKISETLPVTSRDAAGAERAIVNRMEYDAFGNRVATIEAAGLAEERTTRYTFDALGRPLTQTGQATQIYIAGQGWQSINPTDTTRYDSRGNIIDRGDANGNHTRQFYDANDRVIAEVSGTGTLTTRIYDAAGNVLSQRVYGDALDMAVMQAATELPPSPVNANNYRETRFVYDANNRLTETIQSQVGFAERNDATGNLTYAVGDLVTRTTYNALGQPVMNQDGAGRRSYLYYNQLGQKILSIDAAGYAIAWQYGSGGNVISQRIYAQRLPAGIPYTESSDATDLLRQWPNDNARDRITQYEHDALGRLRAEIRTGIISAVNDQGKLVDKTERISTQISYNALGDIASKRDALGNVATWEYDLQGRKSGVLLPVATDYAGKAVRQTTRYQYNGLHQLVRETQEGSSTDAARTVTHQYDRAGRRLSQTLATGDVIRYGYDAQGNTTAEIIDRKQADGSTVHEMTSIAYDAAGREIRRNIGAVDQTNVLAANGGNVSSVRYDAYGNLIGKQTESGNAAGQAQQFTDYDAAGRIWRSNVDSGITKVYFYDRNGRPTVTLQSQTLDLRTMTLEQIQTEMGKAESQIATTITVYDERGQAIQTIQPRMTSNRPNASLMALQGGGTFEGVQLTSGTSLIKGSSNTSYVQSAPPVADSTGISGASGFSFSSASSTWIPGENEWVGAAGRMKSAFTFSIPDMRSVYGAHKVVAVLRVTGTSAPGSYKVNRHWHADVTDNAVFEYTYESAGTFTVERMLSSRSKNYTIDFYVVPTNGLRTQVASVSGQAIWSDWLAGGFGGRQAIQGATTEATGSYNLLRLSNQTLSAAARVDLYYRPYGSSGPYAKLPASVLAGQSGTYVANMAGLNGYYDMLMVGVDAGGKVIRSDRLAVNRANNTVSRASGVPNGPVFEGGVMHLAGLQLGNGKLATSLTYKLNNGTPVTLRARDGLPGLFDIPAGAASANLELTLTAADGSTDNLVGSINPATGVANLQFLTYADSSLVFNNIDKNATRLEIKYREEGKAAWSTATLNRSTRTTTWLWDTQSAGLVPDRARSYRYEVQFDAFDNDGTKLNNGSAVVAAGNIAGGSYTTASITGSSRPRWVGFNPNTASASTLTVRYRLKDSSDAYTSAVLARLPSGAFKLDTSALPPDREYEFTYDAKDAAGKTVATSKGYFRSETRQQVTDGTNVQWMIGLDDDIRSETQIRRSQSYDAFGNIVSETDGNGNTIQFEYNTLGQLVLKRDAATDITLENGFIVRGQRTETRYFYDAAGNLAGTRDANGNLNTQRWHMGGEQAQVAQEWHADGGIRKNAYDVFGNLRSTVNEDNQQTGYRYDAAHRLIAMDRPVSAGVNATDRYELDVKGQRIAVTNALGYRASTRYDSIGRVVETINAEGRRTAYRYTYDNAIASLGGSQSGGWRRSMTDANGRTMTDELDTTGRVMRHTDLGGRVFIYAYNYSGLIASQRSTAGQHIDYRYYGNGYLKNVIDQGTGTTATYEYDNNGNRTFEGYMAGNGQFAFQQQTVTYDARNRVVSIRDPRYDILYEYDALGNRRRMRSVYTNGLGTQLAEQEYWYKYDAMSRFTISMGQLSGARATAANGATQIVRGAAGDGVAFTYTRAGLRASASYARNAATSEHTESYYYDGRGLLTQTRLSDGSAIMRDTDLGGRVINTRVTERSGKVLQNTTRTWTKDNQLLQEHDNLANKGTLYELLADGTVAATQTYSGAAVRTQQRGIAVAVIAGLNSGNNSGSQDTQVRTTFTYEWWDSAKQSNISVQARNSTVDSWRKVWQPGFSHFTYDVNGHSKLAYDEAGKRAFTYRTDNDGQVLKRQELIGGSYDTATGQMNGASKAREHSYYYLDGHRIGDVGNDQTERTDYAQELTALRSNDGRRSYEKFTPSNAADFDANYQPVNSDYPAATPAAYTVRSGDTLQSVARALWGDATLWYLLAEANGLIGTQPSAALTANTTLVIPNQVTNIHNTSATFKPYHPGKALGDTSPTLPAAPPPPPPPSSRGGCGGIGSLLTIAVVVAATVFTAGALAPVMGVAGTAGLGTMAAGMTALTAGGMAGMAAAAAGAAVGSLVGQGFAIASGQQNGFSWKQVGLSALGGGLASGISGALGGSSLMNSFGQAGQFGRTVAQATIGNIATQGIMTASGLQHSFDWRGVAASAAAAGVAYGIGRGINSMMNYAPQANGQGFDWTKQFASNTVAGIAAGATYARLHGDEVNAGRLITGAAVYGAVSASVTEQQLMNAQKEAQQTAAMQRAINAPGMTDADYWNQPRTSADRYADVYGGQATATRGSAHSGNRDAEMQRLMTQAQEPHSQPIDSELRFTVKGVADIFPTDLNQYERIGSDEAGRPLLQIPEIQVRAEIDNSLYLPSSATGLNGFLAGLRGDNSMMEIESTARMLGRYTSMAGEVVNQMFNPKEIAHGMWTAIDSGNPLEMGVAAMGFFPIGNIGKVSSGIERGLLGSTRLETEIARIGQEGHALARHGGAVTDSQLFYTNNDRDSSGWIATIGGNGQVVLPSASTAFHSDTLLVHSDLFIRQNYLEQAIMSNRPNATRITIPSVDIGVTIGRGFDSVSSSPSMFGPLRFNDALSRVTGVYRRDEATGLWRTITIYPVK